MANGGRTRMSEHAKRDRSLTAVNASFFYARTHTRARIFSVKWLAAERTVKSARNELKIEEARTKGWC